MGLQQGKWSFKALGRQSALSTTSVQPNEYPTHLTQSMKALFMWEVMGFECMVTGREVYA